MTVIDGATRTTYEITPHAARLCLSSSTVGESEMIDNRLTTYGASVRLRDWEMTSARLTQLERLAKPPASATLAQLVRGCAFALAVIVGISAPPHPGSADEASVAFIRALGDQAVSVIRRSDMPLPNKAVYFSRMIHRDFDLTGICRFVLGPYWRVATPNERKQFRILFVDRLVRFYGQRLAQSGDGDFVVTGGRTGPDGVIVTSKIISQQAAPIAVDWRLGISHGVYKIKDVAIDGVSMALAQRSQIAELMASEGGQLGTMLATMREGG